MNLHLISPQQVEYLKQVDKIILDILGADTEKLCVVAGKDNRNLAIEEWWWHLDMLVSGKLLVDIEGAIVKQIN